MSYNTNQKDNHNITIESILEKTTEFDIYRYYIKQNIQLGKTINSPLRNNDNDPSFGLYKNKSGKVMYKDFGTGDHGDCFNFVSKLFNLDFKETLERIWKDIGKKRIISQEGINIKNYKYSKSKEILIKARYFTENDIRYWSKFYIKKNTLKRFNVVPIQHYWINDKMYPNIYTKEDPVYAFRVYTNFKIYRPYTKDKKDKFRSSCGVYDLFGLEQLIEKDNILIITKSLKDVMVLYELGYNSVATQGETCNIPRTIIDNLKNRFKHIYLLYDNDEAGIKGSNKIKEKYSFIKQIYIPDKYYCKDIAEIIENKGYETAKFIMKGLIKND